MQMNFDAHIPHMGGFGTSQPGQVNGKDKAQGTGGTAGIDSKDQTEGTSSSQGIKYSQADKSSSTSASSTPKLDPPGSQTSFEIGTAAAKFVDIMSKSNADSGKGLFILYQLLRLLEETVNQQKVSMQAMRQNETQLAIANIQREADTMSSAAKTALIFGVVSAAIQGVSAGMSMAGGIKGLSQAKSNIQLGQKIDVKNNQLSYNQPSSNVPKSAPAASGSVAKNNVQIGSHRGPQGNAPSQPNEPKMAGGPNKAGAPKGTEAEEVDTRTAAQIKSDNKLAGEIKGMERNLQLRGNKLSAEQNIVQGMAQMGGAISTGVKGLGDSLSQEKQADAKHISAETQQLEQESQKTHDLTNSLDSLIQAVLKLMNSVRETEHEVNANIARGI